MVRQLHPCLELTIGDIAMLPESLREELIAMGLPQMMHEQVTLSKILEIRTGSTPEDRSTADELARALIAYERKYVDELVMASRRKHIA